jgi:hypothetical protein
VRFTALAIVVLAVACGNSKDKCKAEAGDLVKLLRAVDHGGQLLQVDDDMHLVPRPELPHTDNVQAPVVIVKAAEITYQGQLIADVAELRDRLDSTIRKIQDDVAAGRMPKRTPWDRRVYLEIDENAKWGTIASVADAAGEVGFVPYFVFALPVTVQRPPRAPIDDELDRITNDSDPSNKATRFAKLVSDQVHSCPAIAKLFGTVAAEEGTDKAKFIIDGMGPALVDCNCAPDMANLRSAMYRLLSDEHPIGNVAVTIARDAPPLELPAGTPWRDAAARLAPGAKLWLVAK